MVMDLPAKPAQSAYVLTLPRPPLSSIIRIPPENKAQTYRELLCSEEDKANIRELITAMGEKGYLSLLSDRTHMRLLGSQINHVHPLKFLSVVFDKNNPYLAQCINLVMEDKLKRTGFLEGHSGSNGLGHSLIRETEKGKITPFLPDFAQDINVPLADIKPFFDGRDWEGLVRFLISYRLQDQGMDAR